MDFKDEFKKRIKYLLKKQGDFTKDEIELILLIFDVLQIHRRKYAASACAAAQGFDFGIRAMEKHQQCTAAITLLERLITKVEHQDAKSKDARS